MASWQRKLGSKADRETKYDLGHDAAHQLVSATLKQTSNSAVVKDQRWGYDSIGNRTREHDLSTGVTIDYSHNNTNQLLTKKTYSSGQKPWVKGSLDEAGHVNLGSGPVAVKGDGSFEGQAPARTTTIIAKDASGNLTFDLWQLTSGSGATPDYLDTTPLPPTPAKWTYKVIYRVGDQRVGQWSDEVIVTVGS